MSAWGRHHHLIAGDLTENFGGAGVKLYNGGHQEAEEATGRAARYFRESDVGCPLARFIHRAADPYHSQEGT